MSLLVVVDPASGVPVYRQLMDQVKFHVTSGLLAPGAELPSTRALSAQLGVNPMTISKAYSFLEKEGVVERRPGRPLIVKAVAESENESRKLEQLRESLTGAATMARQLGVDSDKAMETFRELLGDATESEKD